MPANVLVDAARVVSPVVAVGALQTARAVLHHVATQQLQVGVGVETVRTSVQLQRNTRRGSHADGRRFRDQAGRMFRGGVLARAVHGATLRRRNARLPRQQVVVADVLQRDRALFQHPLDALVLFRITHVSHGDIQTDVLRAEVFAHAPSARLCVRTVYAPTTGTFPTNVSTHTVGQSQHNGYYSDFQIPRHQSETCDSAK